MSIFTKSPFRHVLGDGPLPHSRTLRTSFHQKARDTLDVFWNEDYGLIKKPLEWFGQLISFLMFIPFYFIKKLSRVFNKMANTALNLTNRLANKSILLFPLAATCYLISTVASFIASIFHEVSRFYTPIDDIIETTSTALNKIASRSLTILLLPIVAISHIVASTLAWKAKRQAEALIVKTNKVPQMKDGTTMALGALMKKVNPTFTLDELNIQLKPKSDTLLIQSRDYISHGKFHRDTYAYLQYESSHHPGLFALAKLNPNVAIALDNESMLFNAHSA